MNTSTRQQVRIYGQHIGYQFAATRMGHRTIHCIVHHVHIELNSLGELVRVGIVRWHDRNGVRVVSMSDNLPYWTTCDQRNLYGCEE